MLSRRIPRLAEPNAWSRSLSARRGEGGPLLDLTEANPTAVGLAGDDAALRRALEAPETSRYDPDPRGLPAAREAIAAYLATRGAAVSPDSIVVTSGTSEAYAHLFRLLCDPGDEVLVPQPSYPLFEPIAALEGVALGGYPLVWEGRWRLDVEALEHAIGEATRAIVVVQPNHPTGSCLDAPERAALDAIAERRGLAVIADEVFGDYGWGRGMAAAATDAWRLPSLLAAPRALTFGLSGLSKVCGLPQHKLSWIAIAGPDTAVAEARSGLEWIADLFLSVATPVQRALPGLFDARAVFQSRVRERIASNRAALAGWIARRPEVETLAGDGGWVAVLRLPQRRTDEEWALAFMRENVIVHPGHFYDFAEPWFVVVSLIVEPERFIEGLARIGRTLEE